ncbi:hypothetical protein JR666_001604 [Salmonella enterica]|nr:hypothetical protein [Salmonella enterica]
MTKDSYGSTHNAAIKEIARLSGLFGSVRFGDRIAPGVLLEQANSRSLIDDTAAYDEVLELACRLGVLIVPGKG